MGTDNVIDHPKKNIGGGRKPSIKATSLLPPQSVEERERLNDEKLALVYGHKIQVMRKRAGLTQVTLALMVGKDQATIARLEKGNGGHILNLKTLHLVADACGFNLTFVAEPKTGSEKDGAHCEPPTPFRSLKTGNLQS